MGKHIPFPVLKIPFPVLKIYFETLGKMLVKIFELEKLEINVESKKHWVPNNVASKKS